MHKTKFLQSVIAYNLIIYIFFTPYTLLKANDLESDKRHHPIRLSNQFSERESNLNKNYENLNDAVEKMHAKLRKKAINLKSTPYSVSVLKRKKKELEDLRVKVKELDKQLADEEIIQDESVFTN